LSLPGPPFLLPDDALSPPVGFFLRKTAFDSTLVVATFRPASPQNGFFDVQCIRLIDLIEVLRYSLFVLICCSITPPRTVSVVPPRLTLVFDALVVVWIFYFDAYGVTGRVRPPCVLRCCSSFEMVDAVLLS